MDTLDNEVLILHIYKGEKDMIVMAVVALVFPVEAPCYISSWRGKMVSALIN